jgi:hypothetical protein
MEDLLNQYSLLYGTDNLFSNSGTGNAGVQGTDTDTGNNIERVDLVFQHGVGGKTEASLQNLGFLINERGGNDFFFAAAILAVDGDGNPTQISTNRVLVMSEHWGAVGPQIRSTIFMGLYSGIKVKQDLGNQTVSGVYLSLSDLQVPVDTRVYGISLVASDYPTTLEFMSPDNSSNSKITSAASTNNAGGLDMMSGGFFSREENEFQVLAQHLRGNVWHDLNLDGVLDEEEKRISGTGASSGGSEVASTDMYIHVLVGGKLIDNIMVAADGSYEYNSMLANMEYTLILGTSEAAIGATPSPSFPSEYSYHLSNFDGSIQSETPGVITFTSPAPGEDVENVNFGLQKRPVADDKEFLNVPLSNFTAEPLADFPSVDGFLGIPVNAPVLQKDNAQVPGGLTGSDEEDGEATMTGVDRTFRIHSIQSTTQLYFDFGGDRGIDLVVPGDVFIDFDYGKRVLYGEIGASEFGFEYELQDEASQWSPPAEYRITTPEVLPVALSSFEAFSQEGGISLRWSTSSEIGVHKFDVERRSVSSNWRKIGEVVAQNRGFGYTFLDVEFVVSGYHYYRLKMIDLDGSFTFSPLRVVRIERAVEVFPNPADQELNLPAKLEEIARIKLVNGLGTVVLEQEKPQNPRFSIAHLPA